MPKIKMTAKGLDALTAKPHPTRTDYFDATVPGLCLRVGARTASWYYMQRIDGKLTRLPLGAFPAVGLADARQAAGNAETQVAEGKHPKAELARERAEKRESRALDEARIFRNVAESWAALHLPKVKESTRKDYRRELDHLIAKFGDDDVASITRGQLNRHLDWVQTRIRPGRKTTTGLAANVAAVVIRKVFAHADDRLDLGQNVAASIKNRVAPIKRERSLERDELRLLWRACERAGYPYGHAIRFALCVGQRVGEMGKLRRSDIDSTGEYWIQKDNKTNQRIDIYLADHARAILDDCPNFGARSFVFSAQGGKTGLRNDIWNKAIPRHIEPRLAQAAEELGLSMGDEGWRMHDLRRTLRSGLTGWTNTTPEVAERVLNHAIGGVRGVYDHADYKPHRSGALLHWNTEMDAVIAGEGPTHDPLAKAKAEIKAKRARTTKSNMVSLNRRATRK